MINFENKYIFIFKIGITSFGFPQFPHKMIHKILFFLVSLYFYTHTPNPYFIHTHTHLHLHLHYHFIALFSLFHLPYSHLHCLILIISFALFSSSLPYSHYFIFILSLLYYLFFASSYFLTLPRYSFSLFYVFCDIYDINN